MRQVIVNAMERRSVLASKQCEAECNHTDDDIYPPSQDEAAPACDEDAAEQDQHQYKNLQSSNL